MGREELIALQPRGYQPRTSDGKATGAITNLLTIHGYPLEINRAWAGDITYLPVNGGWIYLAIVIDLCSRKIIGWQLGDHLRVELVANALQNAIHQRPISTDLYFHSDRGSQYDSTLYKNLLTQNGLRQSMSAKGNPYHNARVESTFSRIKAELLQGHRFRDTAHARAHIQEYIQRYYNAKRLHSSLQYLAPNTFEALLTLDKLTP
jgi:transposase InsO family protein